jgi:flagellar biosynthesis/type III secretory pathway chaperone
MIDELNKLMINQEKDLKELLNLLEIQNKLIVKKDLFGLEGVVDKLSECSKRIAKQEIERRKLIGKDSVSEIVNKSNNDELKQSYKKIKRTLNLVISKKEGNEILLKQKIIFNTKILNIMNPSRSIKTYNAYGNLSK